MSEKKHITRRQVLKLMAMGAAGTVMAGCAPATPVPATSAPVVAEPTKAPAAEPTKAPAVEQPTAAPSVPENTTAVLAVTATDPDAGTTFTYSLAGGADQAKFSINGSTGALAFLAAPNFEPRPGTRRPPEDQRICSRPASGPRNPARFARAKNPVATRTV